MTRSNLSATAWHCSEAPEAQKGADIIARHMLTSFADIDSVGDVGCSVGTFLKAFSDLGVASIQGYDAEWVNTTRLVIPQTAFQTVDLSRPVDIQGERFDLLLCLEVAEHLPLERAESFIADLVTMSDLILFSAAIPGQGGVGHINEQWQSYWRDLFAARDYRPYDFIRKKIWSNTEVPVWYRQNMILYSATPLDFAPAEDPFDVVHPEQYLGVHYRDTSPSAYMHNKAQRLLSRLGLAKGE